MENKQVYEELNWEDLTSEVLQKKTLKIISMIPDDVKTILDVGCGNGAITNILNEKFDVTAVDRSKKALSFVQCKKVNASSDELPFADNSFDMVFSSELLEHLEEDVLNKTISEIQRVTRKYIFISVPNKENLKKKLIQCTECNYIFDLSYHLHSFTNCKAAGLFPQYDVLQTVTFGSNVRAYNHKIADIKMKLTPPVSWIPNYRLEPKKRNSVCPKCEAKFSFPYKFNLIAVLLDSINILITKKEPYWLMMLLVKK